MTQWRTIAGASAGLLAVAVAGSGASAAPLHPVAHAAAVTESRLRTPAQGTTDYFGYASAASGTTVVVGSFGHKDGANADEGAVYVYTRPSHGWSSLRPTATLTPPDGAANDEFGEAVAISGRTIVVGAHQHKSSQGAVYVYIEPKHGWKTTSHAAAELTASGAANGDLLGSAVGISGATIVAGASGRTVASAANQGVLDVFTKPASGWHSETQVARLNASDGAANDNFGQYVAITGSTIVGGSWIHNSDTGQADLFTKPSGGWADGTETRKLTAAGLASGDEYGTSVSAFGNVIAVGAPVHAPSGGAHSGSVFVYQKPPGGWDAASSPLSPIAKISQTVEADGSYFGEGTSLSSGILLIGATGATVGSNLQQGAIYPVFQPGNHWATTTASVQLVASDGQSGDHLGESVAVSGNEVVGGADGAGGGRGSAYLWAMPGPKLSRVKASSKAVSFRLDQRARVTISLLRHGHAVAHAHRTKAAGRSSIRVPKSVFSGRCVVKLTAKNPNGQSKTHRLKANFS